MLQKKGVINQVGKNLVIGELLPEFEDIIVNEMKEWDFTLISPLSVIIQTSKNKTEKIYLNLNVYRNLHYVKNNKAKIKYKSLMVDQISKLPKMNNIEMLFILHRKGKRKGDRHNVCCIVQKFFCDALVETGIIKDDTDEFIFSEKYESGASASVGYCEIKLKEKSEKAQRSEAG